MVTVTPDPGMARNQKLTMDELTRGWMKAVRSTRPSCAEAEAAAEAEATAGAEATEVVAYREAAETAMGYLSRELIEPILRQHPDLESEKLKGPHPE